MAKDMEKELDDKEKDDVMQNVTVDPESGEVDDKDEDCKCEESFVKVFTNENVNLSEEVGMIFEGQEDLSEDFKVKVQTILETAMVSRLNEEIEKIEEEAREALEVRIAESEAEMANKIDEYLEDYVVPKWLEENKLAVESGIKAKIAENFLTDFKELLESYDLDITESEVSAVEEAESQVAELKESVNQLIEENAKVSKEIVEMKKEKVLAEASKDLALTEAEKLKKLSSEIDTKDLTIYEEKVKILKDSIFESKKEDETKTSEKKYEVVSESVDDPWMNSLLGKMKHHKDS